MICDVLKSYYWRSTLHLYQNNLSVKSIAYFCLRTCSALFYWKLFRMYYIKTYVFTTQ